MFTQIKTSTKNRENVVELTRKFNLGAENVIARIALAYSLQSGDIYVAGDGGAHGESGTYCGLSDASIRRSG